MVDVFRLYISAANDLEPERDLLGRIVTEIPTTLGWRIVQTPHVGESLNIEAIIHSDVHILLLGSDIRAPIGFEWLMARRAQRISHLFLKRNTPRTLAAQAFVREIQTLTNWRLFSDISDLRHQVLILITDHIINHPRYYELKENELLKLKTFRDELQSAEKEPVEETRGGAGDTL
jgi:hypothetical protein